MCDVVAAVVAVGAVAGAAAAASNKPKTPTTTQSTSTPTSGIQGAQVGAAMEDNQVLHDLARDRGTYQGDLSAGINPLTTQGLAAGVNYANGQGGALARDATTQAGTLIGTTPGFVDRAEGIATNGAGPANATAQGVLTQAATGAPLATSGAAGATGLTGQTGALSTAQGLVQQAQGDPAQRALATGGAYAADPVVQQQIDNAALDVTRNFNEATAPGLNARASAGGNLNSARAGIAEAVAQRDAGAHYLDVNCGCWSSAYWPTVSR